VPRRPITGKGQKRAGMGHRPPPIAAGARRELRSDLTRLRRAPNDHSCSDLSGGRCIRPEIGRQWDGARAGVDHVDARAAVVVVHLDPVD
jgi:hypothetical protein